MLDNYKRKGACAASRAATGPKRSELLEMGEIPPLGYASVGMTLGDGGPKAAAERRAQTKVLAGLLSKCYRISVLLVLIGRDATEGGAHR
jgi:hypothetical protein